MIIVEKGISWLVEDKGLLIPMGWKRLAEIKYLMMSHEVSSWLWWVVIFKFSVEQELKNKTHGIRWDRKYLVVVNTDRTPY